MNFQAFSFEVQSDICRTNANNQVAARMVMTDHMKCDQLNTTNQFGWKKCKWKEG